MKRSTAFLLLLGVCFVVGMDIYATMSQVGGHNSLSMWLMVQQQTPALWAIDGIAVYAILLTMSYTGQVRHAEARRAQVEMLQVEHQAQMEPMLTNMAKADEINATQEVQLTAQEEKLAARDAMIAAQEETIRSLSAQTAALQREVMALQAAASTRQGAFTSAQPAGAAIPAPADVPAPVIDAARDGAMLDVTLPDATTPIQDDLIAVPDEPILPSPITENAPNNVIMEPIYFLFVPVEEEAPAISSEETALAAGVEVADVLSDATVQADEVEVADILSDVTALVETVTAGALTSAIPSPERASKTFDEAHAVVAPLPEAEASTEVAESPSGDSNLPFPHSRPALRLTRWQRKL
jgi:hypothetical protein